MTSPSKTDSQLLGIRGERAFLSAIPCTWGTIKHDADFGIDLMLEIWTEDRIPQLVGRDIAVQIKSHDGLPVGLPPTSSRERSYTRIRAELLHERLKRSTLAYLTSSNAFIASIYLGKHRLEFRFEEFLRILPGMLSQFRRPVPQPDYVIALTPLRPIASDFLAAGRGAEIRVPVHPLNFCELLHSRMLNEDGRAGWRGPDIDYAQGPTARDADIILFGRWEEVIADSLAGENFDTIFRIRYAPFTREDPVAFLREHVSLALSDTSFSPLSLWKLFECVIAGFFFKIFDMRWLDDVIALKSEFFSLLTLRLFRYQQAPLPPQLFATYLMASSAWPRAMLAIPPIAVDPFNCLHGKTSIREFYDEACGYLVDLIDVDIDLARKTIRHVLGQPERFGVNELSGQMIASWMPTKLPGLVTDIIREHFGTIWDPADDPALEAIRALDSIGVICLDFSPSEK